MSLDRLRGRCASAQVVATGFVLQRQLRFHKIGRDGSGKADAFLTGDPLDRVWGVVVRCLIDEKEILDRAETLGIGYEHADVKVRTDDVTFATFLYQAKSDRIDANLRPATWYHQHVIAGAKEHSLPQHYQRMIENYDA